MNLVFLGIFVGVEISRDYFIEYVDLDFYGDFCWKVFCFRGFFKLIIFLWVNFVVCIIKIFFYVCY